MLIRNVLRYPGGKSRAVELILSNIPADIKEFREPMVGGGAVALAVKQIVPHVRVIINDINYDLICFWRMLRDHPRELVAEVRRIKETWKDGRALYEEMIQNPGKDDFEKAVRFYVLNRITFSGTVESGGYSQQAFEKRFTMNAIEKLEKVASIVKDFEITCGDYERWLFEEGEGVFIFLDPPYYSTVKSKLYGKNGDLHVSFDHERFAQNMKKCNHLWLITYDDSPEVRKLFDFAYIYEWELQYGMNNYKQKNARKGKELFITNYRIESVRKSLLGVYRGLRIFET